MLKLITCLLTIGLAQATEAPFWKSKANVYERIQNHEIVVNVTTQDVAPQVPHYLLKVAGGGQVKGACDLVFAEAQKYEALAGLSGYITHAKYDAVTHFMDLTIEAFGQREVLQLAIEPSTEPEKQIKITIAHGALQGFELRLSFAAIKPAVCEVGMGGDYKFERYPISRVIFGFGMEIIFRHMAERLRGYIEDKTKQSNGQPSAFYERIPAPKYRPRSVNLEQGFSYERRVAFIDTDAMGVVHHANYLRYCEEARVAWMRSRGLSATHFPHSDKVLAVLNYQVWHLKPAFFDDALEVRLQVRREGVKVRFQYSMFKSTELIAQAETLHFPIGRDLRPVKPDQQLLKQLEREPWTETWLLNS